MAISFEFTKMPGHGPLTRLAERFFMGFDRQQTVFERRPLETQAGTVFAVTRGERQIFLENQIAAPGFIGFEVWGDLFEERQRLSIVDRICKARGMMGVPDVFPGDFAYTGYIEDILEKRTFRAADGYS